MQQSDQIGELAAALAKAQSEMSPAIKNTKAYNYKYVELAQILEIVIPALTKNQIAVVQAPETLSDGKIAITTQLMHSSGQWMRSTIDVPPIESKQMNLLQAYGGSITYARRYGLASTLCIAEDKDDDGKSATPRQPQQQSTPIKMSDRCISEIKDLMDKTSTNYEVFLTHIISKEGVKPIGGEIKLDAFPQSSYDIMKAALVDKHSKMVTSLTKRSFEPAPGRTLNG
jgi:hypothetical protein